MATAYDLSAGRHGSRVTTKWLQCSASRNSLIVWIGHLRISCGDRSVVVSAGWLANLDRSIVMALNHEIFGRSALAPGHGSAINKPIVEDWDLSKSAKKSTLGFMPKMEKKILSIPDEKRSFDKGQVELVTLGGVTFGRATLQPGWKWSTCVKPIVNTESCQAPHLQYHVSGRLRVRMDDGSEDEFGPGEVSLLPPT
jgi:hypothetical protein